MQPPNAEENRRPLLVLHFHIWKACSPSVIIYFYLFGLSSVKNIAITVPSANMGGRGDITSVFPLSVSHNQGEAFLQID